MGPNGHAMRPRALVVDDDAGVRFTLRDVLESADLDVDEAEDGAAALASLADRSYDLVITDLRMPRVDGMALLNATRQMAEPPKVIMITAFGSERLVVEAMKAGAYDYFKKPFELDDLLRVVSRGVEAVRLQLENERLAGELQLARNLVFVSPAMSRLAVLAKRVAGRDVTVLIVGETGTGKERVAEAIVAASSRAERPFLRFNCAALTPELAEAELFGHARGAFTGATTSRPGLFREADGGTLLLDEVAELDLSLQAKLLRVLQEGEVRAVGEDRPRTVDVRILAATNRDLRAQVERGAFRQDLYYRLNVVTLTCPPLRDRREDIPVLARHFLRRFEERFGTGRLTTPTDLFARLAARDWPGNVRELENCVESMVALSSGGVADTSVLVDRAEPTGGDALSLRDRVEAFERGLILDALRRCHGNRSEAARRLGVGRATLHDKLRKYDIGEPGR